MEILKHYGLIVDGCITQSVARIEEEEGPPQPMALPGDWRVLSGAPDWSGPPGARLRWVDFGVPPVLELPALEASKAEAIARTYPDVDAVYDAAIGRRATEYSNAEAAARAFMAAEVKPVIVSGYITGHARSNPTGQQQTNEWAAQQIIERADAFRWAELQMRNVRFDRQADMRASTTPEELAAAVGAWNDFIIWLSAMLGL